MKFIHLSDLHIGKSLGDFNLIKDQEYILDEIVVMADAEKVDAVMIAGDVYDKSIPSEEAVKLFDRFICKLAELSIKVFIISGNHDSDIRLGFASSLLEKNNIFLSTVYDGKMHNYEIEDEYGKVNIYLLPFVKASQVRSHFPDVQIDNYEDALRCVIGDADVDYSNRNMLLAHQFVTGKGEDPKLSGSESPITQNVGLVEKIDVGVFDGFDYVALGHIHSPQQISKPEVRYAGSPLKYSLSEAGHIKSVPLVTVGAKGMINIELKELQPLRDLRHIKGKMDSLLAKESVEATDDFIYVTLTDEDIIMDAMGIVRQYYPNVVKIDYDNSRVKDIDKVDITKLATEKSFDELVRDFYRQMYGVEMSEDELAVMRMVGGKAGVIDETD